MLLVILHESLLLCAELAPVLLSCKAVVPTSGFCGLNEWCMAHTWAGSHMPAELCADQTRWAHALGLGFLCLDQALNLLPDPSLL